MSKLAQLSDLLERYRAIDISDWNPPDLALVAVGLQSDSWAADKSAHERVETALTAPGAQGWVRLRSALFAAGADKFPVFEGAGPPLAAEWREGKDTSVQLRGGAPGGGLAYRRFVERAAAIDDTLAPGEIGALREVVKVLRHPAPLTREACGQAQDILIYHVFWAAPDDDRGAVRRLFARFVGFGAENRVRSEGAT